MKKTLLTTAFALSTLGIVLGGLTAPSWSQSDLRIEGVDLGRAKNLARQTIEELNGGLAVYQAERAMHGPARQSPHVDNGDGSWTFTFMGGTPGSANYTMESVVLVTDMGAVTVEYNGSVRSAQISPAPTPTTDAVLDDRLARITLSRAKNLARQTAETANGGIGVYRAEPAMHGPVNDTSYVDNGDGSWTFTFMGGSPGSTNYTVESVVTVTEAGTTTLVYNGAVRN